LGCAGCEVGNGEADVIHAGGGHLPYRVFDTAESDPRGVGSIFPKPAVVRIERLIGKAQVHGKGGICPVNGKVRHESGGRINRDVVRFESRAGFAGGIGHRDGDGVGSVTIIQMRGRRGAGDEIGHGIVIEIPKEAKPLLIVAIDRCKKGGVHRTETDAVRTGET